ncbi:MAG: cupin domain-containing protein [Ignavibacteriaceae bacterium]|nr:cupin domain-containing protein [Ignavibacteriaceae bacterium]
MNSSVVVSKLVESIEVQSNSIVSKQIIKKTNGNITLFGFDKGETLSEHTSPYDAFVYIVEGKMEIRIGGISHIVEAGDQLVMPANIPHGLMAIEKVKMLLCMIK